MALRIFLAVLFFALAPVAAWAHPHVWVDAASEALFDEKGRIVAIRHHWLFDEAFSAYALQGLDTNRDGTYSTEELTPLARENVESLADFGYFTFLSVGDYEAGYAAATDYYLELNGDRLLLHFTLPLAQPFFSKSTMLLQVYDPEYYVAFSLPNEEAVRLVDAPEACQLTVYPAQELSDEAAAALAAIGPERRELPPELKALAVGLDNSAEIACGGAAVAETASEAATELAQAGNQSGDLTALPAKPAHQSAQNTQSNQSAQGIEATEPRSAPSRGGGLIAQINAWQAAFSRDLTAALKSLKDGGAFWWLGGISFLYGIVHAAGPGHGKVVISSYLVANESRVRRGVVIAFIAAFAQAVVAIALIGTMAVVLNMTSMAITGTAKMFEAGSFALVVALGLYLLARKGRDVWALASGGHVGHHHRHHHHGHHHHRHDLGAACHHHFVPSDTRPGLSGAAAAVLSVGIRPCSGALVVLVFALAQGVFWAGVASTFLMALGTAITVAALAAVAVGAKDIARRLTRGGDGATSAQIMLGLELLAALFITALGAVLLYGALSTS